MHVVDVSGTTDAEGERELKELLLSMHPMTTDIGMLRKDYKRI